jgi:hypothetical protein
MAQHLHSTKFRNQSNFLITFIQNLHYQYSTVSVFFCQIVLLHCNMFPVLCLQRVFYLHCNCRRSTISSVREVPSTCLLSSLQLQKIHNFLCSRSTFAQYNGNTAQIPSNGFSGDVNCKFKGSSAL